MITSEMKCCKDPEDYIDVYKIGNSFCIDTYNIAIEQGTSIHLDVQSAKTLAKKLIEFFDELDQED